jgi:hypothetical protein
MVVELESGHTSVLQPREFAGDGYGPTAKCAPAWRSADELCFVEPAGTDLGSPDRPEIVLWSNTRQRCISKDWPDQVLDFSDP